jgi:hypothetical protein
VWCVYAGGAVLFRANFDETRELTSVASIFATFGPCDRLVWVAVGGLFSALRIDRWDINEAALMWVSWLRAVSTGLIRLILVLRF